MLAALLAHSGGWDEIAMVLGPIVVMGGLLYLANRRAAALETDDGASGSEAAPSDER